MLKNYIKTMQNDLLEGSALMNIITQDFLQITKILDIHQEVKGVEEVMEFLTSPDVVNRMLVASDMGLPALTPIVQELENRFDDTSNFPVCVMGSNKNAVARQNIGRMIKHIMKYFGYLPVDGGLSERARIPVSAGSKYFSTCAVYESCCKAKFKMKIDVVPV